MLIYVPNVDRKAALLAGHELGERPSFEASPADFGDAWPAVVAALTVHSDGTATYPHRVPLPTAEALVKRERDEADRKASELERDRARIAEAVAEYRRFLDMPLSEYELKDQFIYDDSDRPGYGGRLLGEWPMLKRPYVSTWVPTFFGSDDPLFAELKELRAAAEARVDAENAARRAAALPVMRERNAADLERKLAQATIDAAAEAERVAKVAAEQLSTGFWERETPAYNPRREGKPWCASVTGVDARGRLVYDWAEWSGHSGEAGLLRAPCKPGGIVAWGQKDLRRGDRSDHHILKMRDDGSMEEITVVEAVKALRA